MIDRTERLRLALEGAQAAFLVVDNTLFAEVFDALEQELLGRLLACGPEDDEARWRLQSAINVGRSLRRTLITKGQSRGQLEKELDVLEGRKQAPTA